MNNKLEKTIDDLSKLIEISDEKKKEIIERYSSKNDKEIIKELCQIAYNVFRTDETKYNYALAVIRNINPEICPSVEEMKTRLDKTFSNEVEGNMSIEENHKLVNESIVKFTSLFNELGIDYYIVGALPCFLKTGQKLFRYHDDIDIMVNEEDISKLEEAVRLGGYEFHDDRFPDLERFKEMEENKPPHTVLAQNPDNEFHLGFFTFRREEDNSIVMREYSHRLENGEVVVDVLERKPGPIGTMLRYDDTPIEYMGASFRTGSVESVYNIKQYTKRPKDIIDVQKLEPFVDKQKLAELKKYPQQNIEIHNVEKQSSEMHR